MVTTLIQWLNNLRLEDPPIYDSNTRVCSHHFILEDFVSSAVPGFGPKRAMLKPDAVLTVFCFSIPAKRRKLSKAREARALHRSIVDDLLEVPREPLPDSSKETESATRDIGIQIAITIYLIVSLFGKIYCHV